MGASSEGQHGHRQTFVPVVLVSVGQNSETSIKIAMEILNAPVETRCIRNSANSLNTKELGEGLHDLADEFRAIVADKSSRKAEILENMLKQSTNHCLGNMIWKRYCERIAGKHIDNSEDTGVTAYGLK